MDGTQDEALRGSDTVAFAAAEAHCHAAFRHQQAGRMAAAAACYRQAIAALPEMPEPHNNLATALCELGRPGDAIPHLRRATALRPDYVAAHFNLGMALLTHGEFAEGWREYEWRWRMPNYAAARAALTTPQWRGEAGERRRLLVHAEQGAGDTLQFCRLAPLAARHGLRVHMAVPRPLVRLLQALPGVAGVTAQEDAPPPYDLHCPMLSLPWALGITEATIPDAPAYLRADPDDAARWRGRLEQVGDGLRVGIAWAGSPLSAADGRRSIAPDKLAPLAGLRTVRLISLQKGVPPAPAALGVIDPTAELRDFADTAALVANLDLVVCVDTAVAHLAAAMGKPVWLLDRYDHCWRWLAGRRDSPWYPSLRIYRQKRPGDWDAVLAEVARDLGRVGVFRRAGHVA